MGQKRDDLATFFVLCFLALGAHRLEMPCLPGIWTHANTQNLPHFRAFPASIRELSPPNAYFSWQTRGCQIVAVTSAKPMQLAGMDEDFKQTQPQGPES